MIKCSYSLSKGGMYIYLTKSLNYQNVTELSLQKKKTSLILVWKRPTKFGLLPDIHTMRHCASFISFFLYLWGFPKKKKMDM